MEYKSYYKTVQGNEGNRCHYPTRLDTYGCGCLHNCSYCYARSLLDFRGLWHPSEPAVADVEKIRRTIAKKCRPGDVVRLGGMTDCFQPIERSRGVTYETIKALNRAGVGYLIVTKSDLVADYKYLDIYDKSLAHIQVSITSTDDAISRKIEPGAPLPAARIEALERLAARGLDCSIRLSPYIPEFVDVERVKAIQCDKMLVEFLRINSWVRKWLEGSGVDLSKYVYTDGNYKHLPLGDKINLLNRLRGCHTITVCEDVESHQDYWRRKVNPNPDDCCNLCR